MFHFQEKADIQAIIKRITGLDSSQVTIKASQFIQKQKLLIFTCPLKVFPINYQKISMTPCALIFSYIIKLIFA